MAIGNAPWPIGVTMVGIHARTGREKIFSKHVAHVLNDETQRKYIQVRLSFTVCKSLSGLDLPQENGPQDQMQANYDF